MIFKLIVKNQLYKIINYNNDIHFYTFFNPGSKAINSISLAGS